MGIKAVIERSVAKDNLVSINEIYVYSSAIAPMNRQKKESATSNGGRKQYNSSSVNFSSENLNRHKNSDRDYFAFVAV